MAERDDWWERARAENAAEVAVTGELLRRGAEAEFWHSGGGIFTVRIDDGQYEWQFGSGDGDWGWDHTDVQTGDSVSGYLMLDSSASANTVADAIMMRLATRPDHPGEPVAASQSS